MSVNVVVNETGEAVVVIGADVEGAANAAAASASAAETSKNQAIAAASGVQAFRDGAEQFRDQAEGFAENAQSSASAAASSESSAQNSASAAATSESNAQASEQAAAQSATDADNSAQAAAVSESNAATSESNALASEQAALQSEQNAASFEQAVSSSASAAASSAQAAATSEQNALASEQAAGASESNAQASASTASSAKDDAETARDQAQAAKTASETAQGLSESARDASEGFKGQAESARDTALTHRNEAEGFRDGAEGFAQAADSAAQNAASSASAAASSESAAASSASSADSAKQAAETAQSAAETAETNAQGHENKAQQWAINPEDVPVENGEFSARHWAAKALENSVGITSTDSLPEGQNNLYFTDQRARDAVDAADVGLGNVDNTSDADKPISTATQSALNLKADSASLGSAAAADTGDFDPAGSASSVQSNLTTHIDDSTNPHNVTKAQVGLGNVNNTSDADKPVSSATQAALDLKLNANDGSVTNSREWTATTVSQAEAEAGSATTRRAWTALRVRQAIVAWWTGITSSFGRSFVSAADAADGRSQLELSDAATTTVSNIQSGTTKGDVGLGNVDNTSDADKPVSTATQTALNGKADTDLGNLSSASNARDNLGIGTAIDEAITDERSATATLTNKTLEAPIFNGFTEGVFQITDGASVNLDPNNGSIQTWSLAGNRTPGQANWASGQSMVLVVGQQGGLTISWSSLDVVWTTDGGDAPTLNDAGELTHILLWKVGTNIYGARVGDV